MLPVPPIPPLGALPPWSASPTPGNGGGDPGCEVRICTCIDVFIIDEDPPSYGYTQKTICLPPDEQECPPMSGCDEPQSVDLPCCDADQDGECGYTDSTGDGPELCFPEMTIDTNGDGIPDSNPLWDLDDDGLPNFLDFDFDMALHVPGLQMPTSALLPTNLQKLELLLEGILSQYPYDVGAANPSAAIDFLKKKIQAALASGQSAQSVLDADGDGLFTMGDFLQIAEQAVAAAANAQAQAANALKNAQKDLKNADNLSQAEAAAKKVKESALALQQATLDLKGSKSALNWSIQFVDPAAFGGVESWYDAQASLETHQENDLLDTLELKLDLIESFLEKLKIVVVEVTPGQTSANYPKADSANGTMSGNPAAASPDGTQAVATSLTDENGNPLPGSQEQATPKTPESGKNTDGDPVNTWTGAFEYSRVDLEIPSATLPLKFERFYDSREIRVGACGLGWSVPLVDTHLVSPAGLGELYLQVFWGDGRRSDFKKNATGEIWEGLLGEFSKIRRHSPQPATEEEDCPETAGFVLRRPDGMLWYFCKPTFALEAGALQIGWLTKISDPYGNSIRIEREENGRAIRLVDSWKRSIDLLWDEQNSLIREIRDFTGRRVRYSYDAFSEDASQTHSSPGTIFAPGSSVLTPTPSPTSGANDEAIVKRSKALLRVDFPQTLHLNETGITASASPYESYGYSFTGPGFEGSLLDLRRCNLVWISDAPAGKSIEIDYESEDSSAYAFDRVRSTKINGKLRRFAYQSKTAASQDIDPYSAQIPFASGAGADHVCTVRLPEGWIWRYIHDSRGKLLRHEIFEGKDADGDMAADASIGRIWATLYESNDDFLPTKVSKTWNDGYFAGRIREQRFAYDSQNTDRFQQGNLIQTQIFPDPIDKKPWDPPVLQSSRVYDPLTMQTHLEVDALGRVRTTFFAHQEMDLAAVAQLKEVAGWDINLVHAPAMDIAYGLGDLNGDEEVGGNFEPVLLLHPPLTVESPSGPGASSTESPMEIFEHGSRGEILGTRAPNGIWTRWSWERGFPTEMTVTNGSEKFVTKLSYDSLGRIVGSVDPDGLVYSANYDARHLPIEIRLHGGYRGAAAPSAKEVLVSQNFFDLQGRLAGQRPPFLGSAGSNSYAAGFAPELVSRTSYDANGNPILESISIRYGSQTQTGFVQRSFGELGELEGVRSLSGIWTSFERDARGLEIAVKNSSNPANPVGELGIFETVYDDYGEVFSKIAPGVEPTLFEYDGYGRIARTLFPLGRWRQEVRDALGRVTLASHFDAASSLVGETETQYDAWDRPLMLRARNLRIDANGTVTPLSPAFREIQYGYGLGSEELLWSLANPSGAGKIVRYGYDSLGRRTAQWHGPAFANFGVGRIETLDFAGRTLERRELHDSSGFSGPENPSESRWIFQYDPFGRIVQSTDPAGAATKFHYDDRNLLESTQKPLGGRVEFLYDSAARMRKRTEKGWDGLVRTVQGEFDVRGNLRTLIDSLGRRTEYDYDGLDRLQSRMLTGSVAQEYRYAYDHAGRMTDEFRPGSVAIHFDFDPAGRPKTVTASGADAGVLQQFDYDALDRAVRIRDRVGSSPEVSVIRSFSSLGDLLEEQSSEIGGVLAISYDGTGQFSRTVDPSGFTADFEHDPVGRLWQIRKGNEALATFTHHGLFGYKLALLSGGARTEQGFDGTGRVLRKLSFSSANALLAGANFSYDAEGNVRLRTRAKSGTLQTVDEFSYDGHDRLRSWQSKPSLVATPQRSVAWQYDSADNATTVEDTLAGDLQYETNPLNQTTAILPNWPSVEFSLAGEEKLRNGAGGNEWSYWQWDALGRPMRRLAIQGSVFSDQTFVYDGLSRLVRKTETSGPSSSYGYLGSRVLLRRDSQYGDDHFVPGPAGEVLLRVRGSQKSFFHTDPTGSVECLFGANAAIESYEYDPFGLPRDPATQAPLTTSGAGNDLFFLGAPFDLRSSTAQLGARRYDARLGRFLSRDPIGEAGGLNLYGYAGQNPLRWTDPTGLSKKNPSQSPASNLSNKHGWIHLDTQDIRSWINYMMQNDGFTQSVMGGLGIASDSAFESLGLAQQLQLTNALRENQNAYYDLYDSGDFDLDLSVEERNAWISTRNDLWDLERVLTGLHRFQIGDYNDVASEILVPFVWEGIKGAVTGVAIGRAFQAAQWGYRFSKNLLSLKNSVYQNPGLPHVMANHTLPNAPVEKSVFLHPEKVSNLITKSQFFEATAQHGSAVKFERVLFANEPVGITNGRFTHVFTVITDDVGNLVTSFPGVPNTGISGAIHKLPF